MSERTKRSKARTTVRRRGSGVTINFSKRAGRRLALDLTGSGGDDLLSKVVDAVVEDGAGVELAAAIGVTRDGAPGPKDEEGHGDG